MSRRYGGTYTFRASSPERVQMLFALGRRGSSRVNFYMDLFGDLRTLYDEGITGEAAIRAWAAKRDFTGYPSGYVDALVTFAPFTTRERRRSK